MTSNSASLKRSTKTDEVLTEAVRARQAVATTTKKQEKATDARFENIEANTFYKVMFAPNSKPEEKREEVAKILTFEGTKEENRERIKEFELFKEYLQSQREEMAQEIIRLTDTGTFSELKSVYDELNGSLLDFDNRMRPLTDIIDAVYTLRTNGVTFEAFQEILDDRKQEEELTKEREAKARQFKNMRERIDGINSDISALGQKRSLFGFGGVTQAAREEIARKQSELENINADLGKLSDEISALDKRETKASNLGEFAKEKNKLRELLDISTDEHKDRQRALVDSALNFVNTAKERVGSVRSHLGQMNDQIENLADSNNLMGTVYAVLGEGIKQAESQNQKLRESLQAPADSAEDMITKMSREQKKMAVEQHMTMLDASATDTMATYADLTSGAIRIKTMKDAVDQQQNRARAMHSQGISGVADRLSVVLQAVSSAALGEASAMAKDTLQQMAENTNKVAQKESIRIAMGISEQNSDLAKAIDDLGSYGEVIRTATSITRDGLTEMRGKLDELKKLAESVQDDVHDAIAVNADTTGSAQASVKAEATAEKPASPFKLGN